MKARPLLKPTAQILAQEWGLMIRTPLDVQFLRDESLAKCGANLIKLLDGKHSIPALARELPLDRDLLLEVLRVLHASKMLWLDGSSSQPTLTKRTIAVIASPELSPLLATSPGEALTIVSSDAQLNLMPEAKSKRSRNRRNPEPSSNRILKNADLIVCFSNGPERLLWRCALAARACNKPFLPIQLLTDHCRIGPLLRKRPIGKPWGCFGCAAKYLAGATSLPVSLDAEGLLSRAEGCVKGVYPDHALDLISGLFASLVRRFLTEGLEGLPYEKTIQTLNYKSSTMSKDLPLWHPSCRLCSPTAKRGQSLEARTRRAWEQGFVPESESADLEVLGRRLKPLYKSRCGPLTVKSQITPRKRSHIYDFFQMRGMDPNRSIMANGHLATAAPIGSRVPFKIGAIDFLSPQNAIAQAIAGGLACLAVTRPAGSRSTVRHSYREIREDAVDPRLLYNEPGQPSPDDQPIDWVMGVRLLSGEPVYVPAHSVRPCSMSPISFASHKGVACDTSFHRAILAGIYELVECDAFMITWLNRLSPPRMRISSEAFRLHGLGSEFEELSLQLEWIDLTTDLGIPVFSGVLYDRRNPDFFCLAAGAGATSSARVLRVQKEIVRMSLPYFASAPAPNRPIRNQGWLAGSVEHLAFYQQSSKRPLTNFLHGSSLEQEVTATDERDLELPSAKRQVLSMAELLFKHGHEVIVVDLADSYLKSWGLNLTRVLIPGLHSVVGPGNALLPGSRVLSAPNRMGSRKVQTAIESLNPNVPPYV